MTNSNKTDQRVAVITGGAAGIGAALARQAVSRGMTIILCDKDMPVAPAGAEALCVQLDVTDAEAMTEFAAQVFERFGRVDYLFNNAGIMRPGRVWDQPLGHWDAVMNVNLGGVVNGLRAFLPAMIESCEPAWVTNTASLAGLLPGPGLAAYCTSKTAVVALSETLALDLADAKANIGVSVVCPGAVATGIMSHASKALDSEQDATSKEISELMDAGIRQVGADVDAAAAAIFAGVEAKKFWILPNGESVAPLTKRAAQIEAGEQPKFANWGDET